MMSTPEDAVRADLCESLHQLADLLLEPGRPDYIRITDALLHTWAFVSIAQLVEESRLLVEEQLQSLTHHLNNDLRLDTEQFAEQLVLAAGRIA
jgi:hypothetical protein